MAKGKVLIGFTVYNEEKLIIQAIQQFLNQSYENISIIIFDNCSIDKTVQLIESLQDNRIILIKNNTNIGARNNYLNMVNYIINNFDCEYFLFGDVDDLYHKDYLKILVKYLEKDYCSVGVIPKLNIKFVDMYNNIIEQNTYSFELLQTNDSKFFKAFKIINYAHLQYCCLIRSLLRYKYLKIILATHRFYSSIEELIAVIALYLGGISTYSDQVLHTKYQLVASFEQRQLGDMADIYDIDGYKKKLQIFLQNVDYIWNINQIICYNRLQVIALLFYRLFIRYSFVNFVNSIKNSSKIIPKFIITVYRLIKKLKTMEF